MLNTVLNIEYIPLPTLGFFVAFPKIIDANAFSYNVHEWSGVVKLPIRKIL